jgi:hypothetical protein
MVVEEIDRRKKDIKHSRRVSMGQSCIADGVQVGTGSAQLRALEGLGVELRTACRAIVALHHKVDAGNRRLLTSGTGMKR